MSAVQDFIDQEIVILKHAIAKIEALRSLDIKVEIELLQDVWADHAGAWLLGDYMPLGIKPIDLLLSGKDNDRATFIMILNRAKYGSAV